MKISKRIRNFVFGGLAIIYAMLLLFPQILFSNTLEYQNFRVYYHSEKTDINQIAIILDKSLKLLSSSEVFDPEKEQRIFLCDSFKEFTFFAPLSRKSFAVTYPVTQHIFLSRSTIDINEIKRNGSENNVRMLSGVVAHETTHVGLEDELSFLKYRLLPTWKNEGYCDYIARGSSYDEKLGWRQICEATDNNDSPSFKYFRYMTYVQYLLEKEVISFDTFLLKNFNTERVALDSRKSLCSNYQK
ncbi:hypothetical protein [Maribacter sp. 2307UL18-2]|uniref:hypothetical protein n=1 Tax=Maribacter sp. 2307UL18-2 TaxID=3386274 RepID=UPI0039BD0EA9